MPPFDPEDPLTWRWYPVPCGRCGDVQTLRQDVYQPIQCFRCEELPASSLGVRMKPETEAMLRGAVRMAGLTRDACALAAAVSAALSIEGLAAEPVPEPPPSKDAIRMRESRAEARERANGANAPPDDHPSGIVRTVRTVPNIANGSNGGVGGGSVSDLKDLQGSQDPTHGGGGGSNGSHSSHGPNPDRAVDTYAEGDIASCWAEGVRSVTKAAHYPPPRGRAATTLTRALEAHRKKTSASEDALDHARRMGAAFAAAFPDKQTLESHDCERWLGSGAKTRPGPARTPMQPPPAGPPAFQIGLSPEQVAQEVAKAEARLK